MVLPTHFLQVVAVAFAACLQLLAFGDSSVEERRGVKITHTESRILKNKEQSDVIERALNPAYGTSTP